MVHVFTSNNYNKIDEKFDVIKNGKKSELFAPRKKTLALILQFAAVYHIEKKLSLSSLSGMVLN